MDKEKQQEILELEEKLQKATEEKESVEAQLHQEDLDIQDIEGNYLTYLLSLEKIKLVLEEIQGQEVLLRHQRRKKDKIIRHIITDTKTPFVARYSLYQQQLAEKKTEIDELKLEVFGHLLDYCKDYIEDEIKIEDFN